MFASINCEENINLNPKVVHGSYKARYSPRFAARHQTDTLSFSTRVHNASQLLLSHTQINQAHYLLRLADFRTGSAISDEVNELLNGPLSSIVLTTGTFIS